MLTGPESIGAIAQQLPDVRVDQDRARAFAEDVSASELSLPEWRGPAFPPEDTDDTAAFMLVANSVNFSFWGNPKWTVTVPAGELDGSFGLFAALTRALEEGAPLLDASYLSEIPTGDLEHILRGSVQIPMFEERVAVFREVGTVLKQRFGGRPTRVIREAEGSAPALVDLLASCFPSFDDRASYAGAPIAFQKRAQLVPAMLHARFGGQGWGRLAGLDRLTVFADYKLPQVLRHLGVLEYADGLAERVDAEEELASGSSYEIQIRIATLWAGELIRRVLSARFPGVTAIHVDGMIWSVGQTPSSDRLPYHLTRTIFY
ncbi:MAG: hypothetical protein HOC74_28410 [Gemmatimonadetes bacterium]|jgi:hypothetical protein|nr:hypothetical protein [Gemmatimonadota bacterium]